MLGVREVEKHQATGAAGNLAKGDVIGRDHADQAGTAPEVETAEDTMPQQTLEVNVVQNETFDTAKYSPLGDARQRRVTETSPATAHCWTSCWPRLQH